MNAKPAAPLPGAHRATAPLPGQHRPAAPMTSEQLRSEVEAVLSEPAPTPEHYAAQMEQAHEILQKALSKENGGTRG